MVDGISFPDTCDLIVQYGEVDHKLANILYTALTRLCVESSGRSITERLVRENKHECLKVLVTIGLITIGRDTPSIRTNYHDESLLIVAIRGKAYQCLEFLLLKGSDVNNGISEKFKRTSPLQFACEQNDLRSVQLLIHHGAEVNSKDTSAGSNSYSNLDTGDPPLLIACQKRNRTIVATLLDAGAKVNVTEKRNSLTPLVLAAKNNDVDILNLLINHETKKSAERRKHENPDMKFTTAQEKSPSKKVHTANDECVICLVHTKNCLFLPCAHLACCQDCGGKHTMKFCPVCRSYINQKLQVYK